MAITINYNPSIAAAGQVASQYGGYLANQQNFQNNLQLSRLMQQDRQFYDNMRFRQGAMLFQEGSQRRSEALRRNAARESQLLNIASQQQQNAFNAQQGNARFQQQIVLQNLRDKQANQARDAEFKQQKDMLKFRDELTREQYQFELDEQQKRKMEEYRRSLSQIDTMDSFSDEEKDMARARIHAKMLGIQPLPKPVPEKIVPDDMQPGMTFERTNADGSKSTYFMGFDYKPQHLNTSSIPSKKFVAPDGSVQIEGPDGKPITVSESYYSDENIQKRLDAYMKIVSDPSRYDQDYYEENGEFWVDVEGVTADNQVKVNRRKARVAPTPAELEILKDEFLYGKRDKVQTPRISAADRVRYGLPDESVAPDWVDVESPGGYRRLPESYGQSEMGQRERYYQSRLAQLGSEEAAQMDADEREILSNDEQPAEPESAPPAAQPPAPAAPAAPVSQPPAPADSVLPEPPGRQKQYRRRIETLPGKFQGQPFESVPVTGGSNAKIFRFQDGSRRIFLEGQDTNDMPLNILPLKSGNRGAAEEVDVMYARGQRLSSIGNDANGNDLGLRLAQENGVRVIRPRSVALNRGDYQTIVRQNWDSIPVGDMYYSQALRRFFIKGLENQTDRGVLVPRTYGGVQRLVPHPSMFHKSAMDNMREGRSTAQRNLDTSSIKDKIISSGKQDLLEKQERFRTRTPRTFKQPY